MYFFLRSYVNFSFVFMEGCYRKFSRCVCVYVFVFNKLVQLIHVQWSKVGVFVVVERARASIIIITLVSSVVVWYC